MDNQFSREELLIGEKAVEKLKESKVVLFGIGGVGSYVVEGLARSGIGKYILVDNDDVCITNINRQLIADFNTLNMPKVEIAKKRILSINPNAEIEIHKEFFIPETPDFFDDSIDYIVDAIDTVTAKIEIIIRANEHKIPIISCMGTGNKLDPTKFEVSDIYKTSVCPLAKIIRKELKRRNIPNLKVVYSKEEPKKIDGVRVPGSISFVPSVAGLIIAGEVVKDIIKGE